LDSDGRFWNENYATPTGGWFASRRWAIGMIVSSRFSNGGWLAAWGAPGRIRSEAAFARPAGVAPIPASSGDTTRHRLSRQGDRKLNAAIHTSARRSG
jgi:hypothetical protein